MAVIVYVPAVLGDVQTFVTKVPPVAVQVSVFVTPPTAVALNACVPGAMVIPAGVIGEMLTFEATVKLVVALAAA